MDLDNYEAALKNGELKPGCKLTANDIMERINFLKDIEECIFDKYPMEFQKIRKVIGEQIVELSIQIGNMEREKYDRKWEAEKEAEDVREDKKSNAICGDNGFCVHSATSDHSRDQ